MKSLIIYTSKHGSTEKVASYLAKQLEADHVNLLTEPLPELTDYEQIIIGGSIYYKTVDPKITGFIEDYLNVLLSKKIALFLVCLMSEESAAEQFNSNFDEALLGHSCADGFFGGVLEAQELNPIEKVVTSFAFKNSSTFDQLYFEEVDKFVEAIQLNC